jgi:hypothetical protein
MRVRERESARGRVNDLSNAFAVGDRVCVRVCVCVQVCCVRVRVRVCVHVCVCVHMSIVCLDIQLCVCQHVCAHMYACIFHKHTYLASQRGTEECCEPVGSQVCT